MYLKLSSVCAALILHVYYAPLVDRSGGYGVTVVSGGLAQCKDP
jgi:hypothetical protein